MKNLKNLGKTLNKNEQKKINGGFGQGNTFPFNRQDCEGCGGIWHGDIPPFAPLCELYHRSPCVNFR